MRYCCPNGDWGAMTLTWPWVDLHIGNADSQYFTD